MSKARFPSLSGKALSAQAQRTLEAPFRGSRNQRILDVKASLAAGCAVETASPRWKGEY